MTDVDETAARNAERRPILARRHRRLVALLRDNVDRILVDTAVLCAWLLTTLVAYRAVGVRRWMLYVVVCVGIVGYAQMTRSYATDSGRDDGGDR